MPDSLPGMPSKGSLTTERRQNLRHPVRPTEYIEIGDSNGGIILDISEGGMAVASAQALVGNQTLVFRFQLPRSNETIEASGEINWIGETKKRAGVRFIDLPLAARRQIQEWIDSETSGHSNGDQKPNGSAVPSSSPKIPQEFPRREFPHQEIAHDKTTAARAHNPPKNRNPFSSVLSSPLDEPEIDESEPEEEEKTAAGSNAEPPPERRAQSRLHMSASTYVQLSDGNGGLMANLSKTGFCVRAAKILESDQLPAVRFQLPDARDFVESSAWIVWKSPSKKTAGARFESLSDEAQSQIAQWIDSQPLPKNAPIKNPLSKNPPSPNPPANIPLEQRERISPPPKTPAPVTARHITLMSPDSVPIPAYISPLAISLNEQPEAPSANNPGSTPSLAKVPPTASPNQQSPASIQKTLAPVPPIIPAPSSAKPVPASAATRSPQPHKPLHAPLLMPAATVAPVAPVALNSKVSKLASPAAFVAPAVSPPTPNLPGKSLSVQSLPDILKGPKNPWNQVAAPTSTTPFARAKLGAPPIFNEPDWSVAPKRPTGYWKIAAMIVVIVGTLLGAATLLRSKKSATPTSASQETAQNSSAARSAPAVNSSSDSASNSSLPNQVTSSSAASGSSREFYDTPRNTTPSKSSPKGDEQFIDEPRPAHSQPQDSSPPVQSNTASDRDQPSSGSTSIQSGGERNQDQSVEQNSGFPEVVRRVQTTPAGFSNANGEGASAPDSSSPSPAQATSRNQQADTNLASAGVTQDSSSNAHPAATSENNSSQRTASASINPSPAVTTAAVPAPSTAAAIPNPVPTVSFFSRFRAIRSPSDAARPGGSDLQIGRLKSGPAPPYPIEAQRQQIQGTVELQVLVGADGSILTVHLVKGPPELASVAMGTVRSWQYGQTTLGGHPVETDQSIYFTFKLTK
jgi:outer membrane biosynthesis protein TonB